GLSDAPSIANFAYTFEALSSLTASLLKQLGLTRYGIYVHDYGAPIGWRLALDNTSAITSIHTQSGNAYEEGFVPGFWEPVWAYSREQTPATEAIVRSGLRLESIRWQYLPGLPDESVVRPETWQHDFPLASRQGTDQLVCRIN